MCDSQKKIALIGGGGHALSVAAAMSQQPDGYVDMLSNDAMPFPWLGDDSHFIDSCSPEHWQILITVVSGRDCSLGLRRRLIQLYQNYDSPAVKAPTAWIAPSASIEKGVAVLHHAVVNVNSRVGAHSVINTGAIVEHDCRIGSNVFIGPGAVICGGVNIGDDVYIGAGAVIRPGISICDGALISLRASVFRNITTPGTYFGTPAKRIK